MNDPETECIVMIGEIGGQLEADAAHWIKADGNRKPVGFIAGVTAPAGRTMGHAGAIVGGTDDTAEAKKQIMRECGIHVVDSAEIGKKSKRSFRIVRYFKLKDKKALTFVFLL
jgi:succinyl-CoA synthetase alpha subunit